MLASVYRALTQLVPANPDAPDFRLGKTLGPDNTHWRRVKKGTPDRYRLFFRFASNPVKVKVIVYVWFNDEDTLRKAGSKTDVYGNLQADARQKCRAGRHRRAAATRQRLIPDKLPVPRSA